MIVIPDARSAIRNRFGKFAMMSRLGHPATSMLAPIPGSARTSRGQPRNDESW
jgi:hypothetical protein